MKEFRVKVNGTAQTNLARLAKRWELSEVNALHQILIDSEIDPDDLEIIVEEIS